MQCQHCSHSTDKNQKSCIEIVPIFSSLTSEEVIEVSMTIIQREYEKGETIYLEGEDSEKLFIISKGKM
jgi:CRP/FNR family transcriptional regulator